MLAQQRALRGGEAGQDRRAAHEVLQVLGRTLEREVGALGLVELRYDGLLLARDGAHLVLELLDALALARARRLRRLAVAHQPTLLAHDLLLVRRELSLRHDVGDKVLVVLCREVQHLVAGQRHRESAVRLAVLLA